MFRRRNDNTWSLLAIALCATALLFCAPGGQAASTAPAPDEVADYLEHHGMFDLLAIHLEEGLQSATGEDRERLVSRLTGLFAQLLEQSEDPVERVSLEERSRRLLATAPASSADDLRLALLRGSYRAAEKIAENRRLRLTTPSEITGAATTLDELAPQLKALRESIKSRMESVDRRVARSSGSDTMDLTEDLLKQRSLLTQCTFMLAWTHYYRGWLAGNADAAQLAEPLFAELLSAESGSPRPEDISVDLRSVEFVARSILGMALCKSMTASTATALAWLHLLEHERTFEALRAQAPVWKMAVHLEHSEFVAARQILQDAASEADRPIPLPWLRLAAVHALEARSGDRAASELVRFAISEFATRQELDEILDLAQRYGVESLGNTGFATHYVNGVVKYQAARARHTDDFPTADTEASELYKQTIEHLQAALSSPDAPLYEQARSACSRLMAWCLYFRGEFLAAREAFQKAAADLPSLQAADASWMAIICLDKVIDGGAKALRPELNAMIDRYLREHPSSEHAPELRLKRAASATTPTDELVDDLLVIPAGSSAHSAAQRRAADMLYQLFRDATGEKRIQRGTRHLGISLPLLAATLDQGVGSEQAELARFKVLCRQILEISLSEGIERRTAAEAAFEAVKQIRESGADIADIEPEVQFRRVQDHLIAGEVAAAATVADELWREDEGSIWSRLASRAMYKEALERWRDPQAAAIDVRESVEFVVRFGGRVLREYEQKPDALDQPAVASIFASVAEASMSIWQSTGEEERGKAATYLYDKLLTKQPRNAAFLRAMALLSEKFGPTERALDCWRSLLSGLPASSDEWFEAKFHFISLLAQTDARRARAVMDQHKQLNPSYGPDPWGARLKGLDSSIPAATPESADPEEVPAEPSAETAPEGLP